MLPKVAGIKCGTVPPIDNANNIFKSYFVLDLKDIRDAQHASNVAFCPATSCPDIAINPFFVWVTAMKPS